MDAKKTRLFSSAFRPMVLVIATSMALWTLSSNAHAQRRGQPRSAPVFTAATPNFIVHANHPEWAEQVASAAESYRKSLAIHWLGHELPQWSKPCPLVVRDAPNRPASGETKYNILPEHGAVVNFQMLVEGTRERILDSVLPHEITHTIVASHFAPLGKPVPRWADEGMCTTVEHESERRKHDGMLVSFLREGKGIPFQLLFSLRDYPSDILPLYAQGYSLTSFLIAQGGPKQFIQFLELGIANDDWDTALETIYGYPLKGKLQTAWNEWVSEGGGDVTKYTAIARGFNAPTRLAANPIAMSTPITTPEQASSTQNLSMHPSTSGSYYLQRFQDEQQAANAIQSNDAIQHTVGQPRPLQTIGGGTVYR